MRQIEEPSHVVVFADSDRAGCLRTHKSTSSSKLFYGSHMQRSTSTTKGVIALSWRESQFDAVVKGTMAGLGAVSMLKDMGLDISNNPPKLIKQCLKCELMRPLEEAGRSWENPARCHSNIVARKSLTRRQCQNHVKSLERRTWLISEPNTLTEEQFEEHWKGVITTVVKEGLVSRSEVHEITRPHPEVFTFGDAGEFDTQSETNIAFGQ